jgi:hypothetical protein
VLPAVNDDIKLQLEYQLQQEREDHTEKRIILILYCLENSHSIGILIEFQAADQVLRAEYIDSISRSNAALDKLTDKNNLLKFIHLFFFSQEICLKTLIEDLVQHKLLKTC